MTVLTRPAYLAAVAILVVNDAWLKYAWPGFVTGKLSDVAGLFAFAVFVSCVTRRPAPACIGTAIAFAIWKSPLVEPLLAGSPFSRVADPTDLFAMAILPVAYWYVRPAEAVQFRLSHAAIAVLSVAGFVNTSVVRHQFDVPQDHPARRLEIALTAEEVAERLKRCGYRPLLSQPHMEGASESLFFNFKSHAVQPAATISVFMTVARAPGKTTLEVKNIGIYHQRTPGNEAEAVADFNRRMRTCFGASLAHSAREKNRQQDRVRHAALTI